MLDFTFDDLMRIKTWHFTVQQHKELVPRNIIARPVRTLCGMYFTCKVCKN